MHIPHLFAGLFLASCCMCWGWALGQCWQRLGRRQNAAIEAKMDKLTRERDAYREQALNVEAHNDELRHNFKTCGVRCHTVRELCTRDNGQPRARVNGAEVLAVLNGDADA